MRRLVAVLARPRAASRSSAAEPVRYRLSFPEPAAPLDAGRGRRSASSAPAPLELQDEPDLAGALLDARLREERVRRAGGGRRGGRRSCSTRPDPYGWTVAGARRQRSRCATRCSATAGRHLSGHRHDARAHQHAGGADVGAWPRRSQRGRSTLEPPAGQRWRAATQLYPGATPARVHRAQSSVPDGQPDRVRPGARSAHSRSTARRFRFAAAPHGHRRRSRRARARTSRRSCARRWRSSASSRRTSPGHYTFLADYLPWASGDGMEHRNSTVITSARTLGADRADLLDTVAHEFFHGWNVERIRPASLEPFDFERANISGELWLGEGFTQYYAPLVAEPHGPRGSRRDREHDGRPREERRAQPGARWCARPKR